MGEARVGRAPTVFETSGVGSCLVIVMHDPVAQVGGMAHAMLPGSSGQRPETPLNALRYVEDAIDALLSGLSELGADRQRLTAKIVGGASMFSLYEHADHAIGRSNVDTAKQKLHAEGIAISGEETGGQIGRSVQFDTASGICSVQTKM